MLVPKIEIVITDVVTGKYTVITSVVACEIESTWKRLTDTAKITLPRNIRAFNLSSIFKATSGNANDILKASTPVNINDIIKRGSKVTIDIGQVGKMNNEFIGYVARVNAKVPFDIFCEDQMWVLKQTNFNKAFGQTNLKEIVSFIYQGQANVIDMDLPVYRINQKNGAKVLADLQEKYGIYSYFRGQVLNVGFAYDLALKNEVVYHFERNVPDDGNELEYRLPEDYKVKITGTSILPGNKVISYTATNNGDTEYNPSGKTKFDGDTETMKFNGLTKEQLMRIVDDQIKKYQIGGYQGTIKTYGYVFARHGDIANFMSRIYPERDGAYFIDKTTVQYGDGFRRVVEPGRKIL